MPDDTTRRIPPAADDLEATTLRRLRVAATLANGLPGARLIVRPIPGQGRTSFVARTQPADLTPCQLRDAILEGSRRNSFEPVRSVLQLGICSRPTFELETMPSVRDLGAGVYSIHDGSVLGLVFATLLAPPAARDAVKAASADRWSTCTERGGPERQLRLRFDSRTAVTVLTGQVPLRDPSARDFLEWVQAAAYACVVEELLTVG